MTHEMFWPNACSWYGAMKYGSYGEIFGYQQHSNGSASRVASLKIMVANVIAKGKQGYIFS